MLRIISIALLLLFVSCTAEFTFYSMGDNSRPVARFLSPSNTAATGPDFSIRCTSTDSDDTNISLHLRIGNGPETVLPGFITNTVFLSNQATSNMTLSLYARDQRGRCSVTNTLQLDVNPPPVPIFVYPTTNWVNTNFILKIAATDRDSSSATLYLKTYGPSGITNSYPGLQTNSIAITTDPGYITAELYAVDDNGNYSTTNTQVIAVSQPGFTEIHAGNLTPTSHSAVALGDLDGDGDPDIILSGYIGSADEIAKIYRNNGNGYFQEINSGTLYRLQQSGNALGDIDGDGDLDLIHTGWAAELSSDVMSRIYFNDGNMNFSTSTPDYLTEIYHSSIALGDIDGDGDLDMIFAGMVNYYDPPISKIYRNSGNGTFSEIHAGTLPGIAIGAVRLGDIDGDGDLDLIMTGNGISKIFRNNGSGLFTEIHTNSLPLIGRSTAELGDLDGDGDLDLFLSGRVKGSSTTISTVYQNDGNGQFTAIYSDTLKGAEYNSSAIGDLDGDGDLDIILSGNSHTDGVISIIYINNGNGFFTETLSGNLTGVEHSSTALADIDGDGDLDFILTGSKSGGGRVSKIYRNNWNRGGYAPYAVP